MATKSPSKKSASADKPEPVFTPTPEAKSKATTNRIIAVILWVVAIALEAVAIFWILRPPFDELVENKGFPQSRFYLLIGALVVIFILAVAGSMLWKKANHLDPASRKETVRFFVQNQLGAIIALIAFVPLIIMIFLNKDMDSKQKGIAGGVGIAVALAAVLLGVDFKPLSQEQAAVESQVVTQLVGEDKVYWTDGGSVVHLCADASDIKNSSSVQSGTLEQALADGKDGITLKLSSELNQCGLAVPENLPDIQAWVCESRGKTFDAAKSETSCS